MKIIAALDSFKGSLGSLEAGEAVRRGILRAIPDAEVQVLPLADGGEGTMEALISALGGERITVSVTGPLGDPVTAAYGCIGSTAVIEMAQAAGLPQVPPALRDPMNTTTRGVGELIVHAIRSGCREFLVGIGGSATNDGGIGMLSALGIRFLDEQGNPLAGFGRDLDRIAAVDLTGMLPELRFCRFRVACDVDNPLCGPRGASAVYGPQKGLDPAGVARMDAALSHYAKLTINITNKDYVNHSGAGAAGGLGFAFLSYLNARLQSGAELVLECLDFVSHLRGAAYLVTGEGRIDGQTAMGKAPSAAAAAARDLGVFVIGLGGSVTVEEQGSMDAVFSIQPGPVSLQEAMDPAFAAGNLSRTAEQLFRLLATK